MGYKYNKGIYLIVVAIFIFSAIIISYSIYNSSNLSFPNLYAKTDEEDQRLEIKASDLDILFVNTSYISMDHDVNWLRILRDFGSYETSTLHYQELLNDPSLADPYDVLLIGDCQEGYVPHAWTTTEAEGIADIGKPIIARGRGGSLFVFALGLSYSNYGSIVVSGSDAQRMLSSQGSHPVLNNPYNLPLTFAIDTTYMRTSRTFSTSDADFEIIGYAENIQSDHVNFGHYKGYENNIRILLWSYEGYFRDDYMTTTCKQFLINQVEFVYNLTESEIPKILDIWINKQNFQIFDQLYITVRIKDNIGVSHVGLYSDLYGLFKYFDMTLISGNTTDGYWNFTSIIPPNATGRTITYSIFVNDTDGNARFSSFYQFTVNIIDSPFPWIVIPGDDYTIIIIIIIGSIAAVSITFTAIAVYKYKDKSESKRSIEKKSTKGVYLGAKEIRKIIKTKEKALIQEPTTMYGSKSKSTLNAKEILDILKQSDENRNNESTYSVDKENIMVKSFKLLSSDIYSRVKAIKNLTEKEKELLLRDLVTIKTEKIDEWLRKVENLEK